jgi:hypothetical protein
MVNVSRVMLKVSMCTLIGSLHMVQASKVMDTGYLDMVTGSQDMLACSRYMFICSEVILTPWLASLLVYT